MESQQHQEHPNVIHNQSEVEQIEEVKEEDPIPVRGLNMVHEGTIKVLASDLRPYFSSKKDFFKLLSIEGTCRQISYLTYSLYRIAVSADLRRMRFSVSA